MCFQIATCGVLPSIYLGHVWEKCVQRGGKTSVDEMVKSEEERERVEMDEKEDESLAAGIISYY